MKKDVMWVLREFVNRVQGSYLKEIMGLETGNVHIEINSINFTFKVGSNVSKLEIVFAESFKEKTASMQIPNDLIQGKMESIQRFIDLGTSNGWNIQKELSSANITAIWQCVGYNKDKISYETYERYSSIRGN